MSSMPLLIQRTSRTPVSFHQLNPPLERNLRFPKDPMYDSTVENAISFHLHGKQKSKSSLWLRLSCRLLKLSHFPHCGLLKTQEKDLSDKKTNKQKKKLSKKTSNIIALPTHRNKTCLPLHLLHHQCPVWGWSPSAALTTGTARVWLLPCCQGPNPGVCQAVVSPSGIHCSVGDSGVCVRKTA